MENNTNIPAPMAQQKKRHRRLTHREKKRLYKQQLALEKKLVATGKIPRRAHYAPRGVFWRVFSLCLSFFFGITVALGGLAGAIVLLGTKTSSKRALELFGLDSEKFIEEAYLNMSILDIYHGLIADINTLAAPADLTLGMFTKYTPVIDEYIKQFQPNLDEFGISINWDTLKAQKFPELAAYAKSDILPAIKLGNVLGLQKDVTVQKVHDNAIMYAISYGSIATDYDIVDGTIQMREGKHETNILDLVPTLGETNSNANASLADDGDSSGGTMDFISNLDLGSLLGLDIRLGGEEDENNAMLYALCYGTEGIDFTFNGDGILQVTEGGKGPTKIDSLLNGANDFLGTVSLGDMLGLRSQNSLKDRSNNAMLYTLCYGKEGEDYVVREDNGTYTLEVLNTDSNTTINDLTTESNNVINELPLGEMLGLNTAENVASRANNAIMYALCYGTEGKDYFVNEEGLIEQYPGDEHKAKTIGDLTTNSNDAINSLQLGEVLGLNTTDKLSTRSNNAMMYTLCYGTEGKDYDVESNEDGTVLKLVMKPGHEAKTLADLTTNSNTVINGLPLGEVLGLNTAEKVGNRAENAMMYALCYGTEGTDYTIGSDGRIEMIEGHEAKTLGDLTEGSTELINGLNLGDMLGLNTEENIASYKDNIMMYSLCYGTEGVDWEIKDGKLNFLSGRAPTTVGQLTESSNTLINGLEVEVLLDVKPESDAIIRFIAYGAELPKGEDGEYEEPKAEEIMDAEGQDTGKKRYQGDAKYKIVVKDNVKYIEMLPDPNYEDGRTYAKKKVGDLTKEDADLLEGLTIGSIVEINSESSGIMQAMKDWTIDDLKDQKKIETLTIGQVLDIEDGDEKPAGLSNIMWTLRKTTIEDLQKEETIQSLAISDVIDLGDNPSGIMKAMQDKGWTLGDLNDQSTIESLMLSDILEIDDTSSGVMKTLGGKSLAELKDPQTIDDLTIGQILDIEDGEVKPEGISNIMWALRKNTIGDLKDQKTIDGLKLGDILDIKDDSSGIMRAMKDWQLSDLNDQEKIESLKLSEILEIDDEKSSGILKAMKNWSISDLNSSARIERLTIGSIIGIGDESSGILKAMKDWRISDLNDQKKIDSLTLGDILTIGEKAPQMLKALQNMSLGEISTSIDTLTLADVLGEDACKGNSILEALRYKQIKELGNAIKDLTVEDIFGNEIWTYATVKDYNTFKGKNEPVPKDNRIDASKVEVRYTKDGETLEGDWYKKGEDGTWTKVQPKVDGEVKYESYVENKIYVDRTETYYIVDYSTTPSEWTQTYDGSDDEITHDDFSYYYVDGEGERHDLDIKYTYTLQDESKTPVTDKRIQTEDEEGDVKYYYTEKVTVEYRYADKENKTYSPTDECVTAEYYQKNTDVDTKLVRYHSGVWFLILGESGNATQITELGKAVTGVATKINDMTLGDMYIHGLITEKPDAELNTVLKKALSESTGKEGEEKKNLSELTISEIIQMISKLTTYSAQDFLGG